MFAFLRAPCAPPVRGFKLPNVSHACVSVHRFPYQMFSLKEVMSLAGIVKDLNKPHDNYEEWSRVQDHVSLSHYTLPNLGNVMDAIKVAVRCPKKKAAKARLASAHLANVAAGGSPRSESVSHRAFAFACRVSADSTKTPVSARLRF